MEPLEVLVGNDLAPGLFLFCGAFPVDRLHDHALDERVINGLVIAVKDSPAALDAVGVAEIHIRLPLLVSKVRMIFRVGRMVFPIVGDRYLAVRGSEDPAVAMRLRRRLFHRSLSER